MAFDVPILLCVFNRPELTARVFEAIARQKPKNLLVAADGPRENRPDDRSLTEQTRRIVERIDWDCVVQARFSASNLGCRQQVAQAITWGFGQFEQLIILEDDCVPHDSFFPYCRELLEQYAEQTHIMTISGNSYPSPGTNPYHYRFSKYPLIWGWASWRRAWKHYDLEMKSWSSVENQHRVLGQYTESSAEREYWHSIFTRQHAGEINTWDYSWTYASWLNDGLTILPERNLVSNIGFGNSATHTFDTQSPMANRSTYQVEIGRHPERIERDVESDRVIRRIVFEPEPIVARHRSIVTRLVNFTTRPRSITKLFHN